MSVIAEFYALIKGDSSQLQGELNKTKAALTGTSNQVKGLSTSSILGFAAIAGAAYKAGQTIMQLADETMKYGLQVHDMSLITGDSAESTSALIQAADDARVSYEQLTTAMRMAVKQGIDPSLEGMMKLADEYVSIQGPIERSQFLIQTFGRSGLEMGKMLENGAAGIKASADEAQRLGLILGQDGVKAAEDYFKAMDNLEDSFKGIKIAIGNDLIPTLTILADGITNGVSLWNQYKNAVLLASEESGIFGDISKVALAYVTGGIPGAIRAYQNLDTAIDGATDSTNALYAASLATLNGMLAPTTRAADEMYKLLSYFAGLKSKDIVITTYLRYITLTGLDIPTLTEAKGGGTNMKGAFANATGGYMANGGYANGSYLVGERGPEVITPSSSGYVAPNETATIRLDEGSMQTLSKYIVDGMAMVRA